MIETIRQGLKADGIHVSISKLCQWFEVPRRTVYYQPLKAAPKVDAEFAVPIKAMIEENPAFGYRTVAHLLDFNKNTVQRIFQLNVTFRRKGAGFFRHIGASVWRGERTSLWVKDARVWAYLQALTSPLLAPVSGRDRKSRRARGSTRCGAGDQVLRKRVAGWTGRPGPILVGRDCW